MNEKEQNMTLNSTNPEQQKVDSQTQLNVSSNNIISHTSNGQGLISTAVINRDVSQASHTTALAAGSCAECLRSPPHHSLFLPSDQNHQDADLLHPQVQKTVASIKEQKAQSQRLKRLSKLQADALKGNELPLEKRRSKLPASSDKPQYEGTSSKKSAHSTSNTSSRQSLRTCPNSQQLKTPTSKISQNGKKKSHSKNGVTINSEAQNLQHQNQQLNMTDDNNPNLKIKNHSQGQLQNKEEVPNMAKFTTPKTPERSTKKLNKLKTPTHNSPFLVSRDPTNRVHRQQLNNLPQQKSQLQIESFRLPSKSQLKSQNLLKSQQDQANQPHHDLIQDFDCSPKKRENSSSSSSQSSSPQAMELIAASNQKTGSQTCVKKSNRDFVTPSRTPQPKSRTLLNSASNSTDFATPLPGSNGKAFNSGRWKKDEHKRFLEALKKYGREWKQVQQHVSTRSSTQARSHAQKFLSKLEKKNIKLQAYLQNWDPDNSDDNLMSDDEKQDNKLPMRKSGSYLNSQQRKRMSKDQIMERQDISCNFMLRGNEMPPRLLKQRSSPMVPNSSIFIDRQQQFDSYQQGKNFGDYQQLEQNALKTYAREPSNILQSLRGTSKNLLGQGKKRPNKQIQQGSKENQQNINREQITPPSPPPLQSRRKSIVSNQTEDDRRSVNSLFPSSNLEMQRRKSCKAQYSSKQGIDFDADSPQVTSKKSRGQKNRYHKIRISNIHQQHPQDNQYPMNQYDNSNSYQFTSEYQRNGASHLNHSSYLPEYQVSRYGNELMMPLTPQPVNRSLLNHRKNCLPLNNGSGYQHVSTPPPPEPPHFQNLILPPQQQQSTHETPSTYHLIPSQSRQWIQMQNKPEYDSNSFNQKQQDVISAIPAINSNYQYSIPPPPPISYQYFMDPVTGNRSYQPIVRRDEENVEEDEDEDESLQEQSADDEQQEVDGGREKQDDINHRDQLHESYLHHQQNQQMQSQFSQQYAHRYRQDLGILRTNYSRNYPQLSSLHPQANLLPQDLAQYYPSSSQQAQQYMNFQLNNPYHQHHHQFQQQQNQQSHIIDSSSSPFNPQYIMGLNNTRNSEYRTLQNNSSIGPDDSYPIMQQQQQQLQQQFISRDRAHSFSDIPQGFKIPSNLNQRCNVEDLEGANNAARSQKYMMMMEQDEPALNPYRAAYQGDILLEQYKYMQDEIAVREN